MNRPQPHIQSPALRGTVSAMARGAALSVLVLGFMILMATTVAFLAAIAH